VVVVWGDHGWHLGDSELWGKHTPLERALHSPLIIRAPGQARAGKATGALAETVDIYPTLVDLCQPKFAETEHPLDGRSLQPILSGERESVRDAAISYWQSAVSIRTPTHRLIVKRGKDRLSDVELYDIRETPDPLNNLADKEPELIEQMRKYLPSTN
jgi:arylsulfatase A-like enzyme